MIFQEITSLDKLLWIVVIYQDVQKLVKDDQMENFLNFQGVLLRKNVAKYAGLP
tara:strand:- start:429 stop:590 length:162 start_codon:yes stop_codon:yes gene_type:complete